MKPAAKQRVILFTRYPRPGKAKTRLIPRLGGAAAARLQRRMTGHAVLMARCAGADTGVTVFYDDASPNEMADWLGGHTDYRPQAEGDLGERLKAAFRSTFESGATRAVVIGTDVPGITPEHLQAAFRALDEHDVVIGPATDGGYYLLGLRAPHDEVFAGIDWGSETVFEATRTRVAERGMRCHLLDVLQDVDHPEDLDVWTRVAPQGTTTSSACRISVIIPTLNEASRVALAVASALPGAHEVLVADGGSEDNTIAVARAAGARVIDCPRGRATQMNHAAVRATGDCLLFLHADTGLPSGYARAVSAAVVDPAFGIGAFPVAMDSPALSLRLIAAAINARTRIARLPYGDQGLFVRRDCFSEHGGFPNVPILEDVDLVERLRRTGRCVCLRDPVTTSARRWLELGPVRTTLRNQRVMRGYRRNTDPERLCEWYRAGTKRSRG